MEVANSVTYANSLLELAERKEDAGEKRTLMLEAAELYLKASKNSLGDEAQHYYSVASQLYLKSQQLRETNLEKMTSKIEEGKRPKRKFKDIGGLRKVKESIRMKIIEPLQHPEVFQYFGKKAGGGVLMYGPPGCGKSLIAEATAGEADVAFFNVRASDIKSKYLGEAEQRLSKLFDDARKEKAAIIFFDEFEALGTDRTRQSSNTKGIVSTLLAEMDGLGNKDQNILVIGATNEPWSIDVALRRSGRFDTIIFVPPPDQEARKEILKIHMVNKPVNCINYDAIATATENFSGADLKALCEDATDIPLKECLMFKAKREITNADFYEALEGRKPTIYPWFNRAREMLERRGEESTFPEVIAFAAKIGNSMRLSA